MSRTTLSVFWPELAQPQPISTYSIPPVYKPSAGACIVADSILMVMPPLPTVHSAAISCGARTAIVLKYDNSWENVVFTTLSIKEVESLMAS